MRGWSILGKYESLSYDKHLSDQVKNLYMNTEYHIHNNAPFVELNFGLVQQELWQDFDYDFISSLWNGSMNVFMD